MNELHSLLKRQLRRFTSDNKSLVEEEADLLHAINDAYLQFDADRRMLEHSLELTSQELLEANVELSNSNRDLEMRVAARTAELSNSESRFRGLFEHAPISIWEEDFSAVRQYIDNLRVAGVVDFSAYFDAHPEAVAECADLVKIVDVNRATLEMYQAESKEQLLANLSKVLGPESLIPFKEELLALARGETSFENETVNYTLSGEKRVIFLRLNVAPGYEETWVKVFVGISDITERRQAEAALAAERDLLQALMDNIPDTIYFKDTASRFTRINRAQVQVLGVAAPEDAIGKTDLDFEDSELARSFYDEEQRIIETGEQLINRIEFNPTPDGEPRWFSATKVPIRNSDGRVIGIAGISRDITERKRVDEKLATSEAELRVLFGAMQDVVIVYDREGRYVQIAPTSTELLYQSPQEMLGKTVFDILPQALAQTIHTAIQESLRTRKLIHVEYSLPLRGGEGEVWKDAAISPLTQDTVFWIARDITERKQAEEALSQSEERFRLMAWATKDAVWDWDLETDQIWWGEGLQKMFHYSADTANTDPEWRLDHIHPEDRAKLNHVIDQALEGGMEFWSKEYRFQRMDGTYADIMDRGYIIRDLAGKAYRMVGAMMDITERKYMESSLRESNEKMGQLVGELQERNREAVLLNEMSHRLQACQTMQDAYGTIADLAKQLFPRTAGALYLFNTPRRRISAAASWGEIPSASQMFTPDNCRAMRRSPTRLLNDQPGPCCLSFAPLPADTFCLPIQVQGEILGVFHLQTSAGENLTETKRHLAYTIVEQSEMALSNLKLREALLEQSIRDSLTGLYNRRYMEEALRQQLSRVTRQLHPLGIIMIDIDHFKLFNDTYGHAAGDALLRELCRFLQSNIRGEDIACRYGGEEFTLILPDASLEVARRRAEHLLEQARHLRVKDGDQAYEGITLSMGVAIYPQHGRSIELVLRAADAALYRAKQEGRDRVMVAEPV